MIGSCGTGAFLRRSKATIKQCAWAPGVFFVLYYAGNRRWASFHHFIKAFTAGVMGSFNGARRKGREPLDWFAHVNFLMLPVQLFILVHYI